MNERLAEIEEWEESEFMTEQCPTCFGIGYVENGEECETCQAEGDVPLGYTKEQWS